MANMQLAKDNQELLTNSKPVRQQFGVANTSIVISLLTKLYSNPIRTLTQEYIANGRDANREVNSNRRMEVTAPTSFNPVMIIRDFGPGLSPERIESVFLLYGASTKRTSNSQNGGFGIGAKSAWAYTDSFNIITYINGLKRTYIAHTAKGEGNLDKIYEEKTSEPNGTEIQIAVNLNDVNKFKEAILRTIFFWHENEKPILKGLDKAETNINEFKPAFKLNSFETYKGFPYYITNHNCIVVDGIPYCIKEFTSNLRSLCKKNFVIHIPNSKVSISPNREELIDDEITRSYLANLDEFYTKEINKHIDSFIKNQNDLADVLRNSLDLYSLFNFNLKYKHYSIYYDNISSNKFPFKGLYWAKNWRRNFKKKPINKINVNALDCLFYNDLPKEPATKIVWRIKKLIDNGKNLVYLLDNSTEKEIIDDLKPMPISSIDASDYKINRQQKAAVKKLEICLHYFNGHGLSPTQEKLSNIKNTIVYDFIGSDNYDTRRASKFRFLKEITFRDKAKVAFVAKGSEKLIAKNPNFIKIDEYLDNFKPEKHDIVFSLSDYKYTFSSLFPIKKELNNKSLTFIKEFFETRATSEAITIPSEYIKKYENVYFYKEFMKHKKILDALLNKYPLIQLLDLGDAKSIFADNDIKAHFINYLNSKN